MPRSGIHVLVATVSIGFLPFRLEPGPRRPQRPVPMEASAILKDVSVRVE